MTTAAATDIVTVLQDHVKAVLSRDIEGTMVHFDDTSVMMTAHGAITGRENIRAFFLQAFQLLTDDAVAAMNVIGQTVHGEFAFVVWSAGPTIPFASDTFCIRDGKIVMQAFAGHI